MKERVLTKEYQDKWKDNNFVSTHIEGLLKKNHINTHTGISNPISSQASCLNFWYPFIKESRKNYLKELLRVIGINVDEILTIKSGSYFKDYKYPDEGNIIFEWIGSKKSPINEIGHSRGLLRTSIDAYILTKINNKVVQILIEWKFTETYSSKSDTGKFLGGKGLERLSRYTPILAKDRKSRRQLLLDLDLSSNWGISDLGYEVFYQMFRQHLLGKETIGMRFGDYIIEDYLVLHLSHSANKKLNILSDKVVKYTQNLSKFVGHEVHHIWPQLLADEHKNKFIGAYWDEVFKKYLVPAELITWAEYIRERYVY